MKSRKLLSGLGASAAMLVLILDSRTALDGMRSAVELCLCTLIPSLFPFIVLSVYLTGNLVGSELRLLRPVCSAFGIPAAAQPLLITGFLGGYPTGAQSISQACGQGQLSRQKAARLLSFCSNAGPAFLFGVVGQAFDSAAAPWLLWLIHVASALFVGLIAKDSVSHAAVNQNISSMTLTQSLRTAIIAMAQVCGWVAVFRTVLCYLDRWFLWMLPVEIRVMTAGILELSNGCIRLRELESESVRFVAASALTAFGGLCVLLQTRSVSGNLSLRYYCAGKLLQTVLSIFMSSLLAQQSLSPAMWDFIILMGAISVSFLRKREKNSSIPAAVGV